MDGWKMAENVVLEKDLLLCLNYLISIVNTTTFLLVCSFFLISFSFGQGISEGSSAFVDG